MSALVVGLLAIACLAGLALYVIGWIASKVCHLLGEFNLVVSQFHVRMCKIELLLDRIVNSDSTDSNCP